MRLSRRYSILRWGRGRVRGAEFVDLGHKCRVGDIRQIRQIVWANKRIGNGILWAGIVDIRYFYLTTADLRLQA
jgi:hypothetical protein